MTLINIITNALIETGHTTDAQQMEAWKEKFTVFVNDGMRDIADTLQLRRTDEIEAINGCFKTADLSDSCVKVVEVSDLSGASVPFNEGTCSTEVYIGRDGTVQVEYRYIPDEVKNDTDQPNIPEHLHPLLVTYVVYREHMTADPNMQRRASAFLQQYEMGKRKAKRNLGEIDTYNIYNVRW